MTKDFFINWLIHIAIASTLAIGIGYFSIYFLSFYTNHAGESIVEVPDLKGINIQDLEQRDFFGLNIQVIDSVYTPTEKPGAVIKQQPTPYYIDPIEKIQKSRRMKEKKKIRVVINRFSPPTFRMFAFYARPVHEVIQLLQQSNIRIEKEIFVNAGVCPRCVVQITTLQGENIEQGGNLTEGTAVYLFVDQTGSKQSNQVELPSLEGLELEEAKKILQESGLNIGNVTEGPEHQASGVGIVKKQSPAPKKYQKINKGSYIHVSTY